MGGEAVAQAPRPRRTAPQSQAGPLPGLAFPTRAARAQIGRAPTPRGARRRAAGASPRDARRRRRAPRRRRARRARAARGARRRARWRRSARARGRTAAAAPRRPARPRRAGPSAGVWQSRPSPRSWTQSQACRPAPCRSAPLSPPPGSAPRGGAGRACHISVRTSPRLGATTTAASAPRASPVPSHSNRPCPAPPPCPARPPARPPQGLSAAAAPTARAADRRERRRGSHLLHHQPLGKQQRRPPALPLRSPRGTVVPRRAVPGAGALEQRGERCRRRENLGGGTRRVPLVRGEGRGEPD